MEPTLVLTSRAVALLLPDTRLITIVLVPVIKKTTA